VADLEEYVDLEGDDLLGGVLLGAEDAPENLEAVDALESDDLGRCEGLRSL
jgi:hypothetical protein